MNLYALYINFKVRTRTPLFSDLVTPPTPCNDVIMNERKQVTKFPRN